LVNARKQFLGHMRVGIEENQHLSECGRRPAVPHPRDIMFGFGITRAPSERATLAVASALLLSTTMTSVFTPCRDRRRSAEFSKARNVAGR
jgi:hypothetical protein